MKALKTVSFITLNVVGFLVMFNVVVFFELLPLGVIVEVTNFSKMTYGILLSVVFAPLAEELSKLVWMKTRGTTSAYKYATGFALVESIYYTISFYSIVGILIVPIRLMTIGMHLYTVRLMSRKGYWAAVGFHAGFNAIMIVVAIKMGWVI